MKLFHRVLLILSCGILLSLFLLSINLHVRFYVIKPAPVCRISIETYSSLWIVHYLLDANATVNDMYDRYLDVKSIMKHVNPDVLYIHSSSSRSSYHVDSKLRKQEETTYVIMDEATFWTKLNFEFWNIEHVRDLETGVDARNIEHIATLVKRMCGGIFVSSNVLFKKAVDREKASTWCIADSSLRVVFFHEFCPYYSNPKLFSAHQRQLVSNKPSEDGAIAVHYDPMQLRKLDPFWIDALTNADAAWNELFWKTHCMCDELHPKRHDQPVIPNIAHFIWVSGWKGPKNVSFMKMLSVLSQLKINKVDQVMLHGDVGYSGEFWEYLKKHYGNRIRVRHYPKAKVVFGQEINPNWPTHSGDVIKLDILRKYGGMYADWDSITLRSHDELRHYDGVIGIDTPNWSSAGHISFSAGYIMFSTNSEFLKMYLNNFHQYRPDHWDWNIQKMPFDLYRRFPFLLKRDDKLLAVEFGDRLISLFHSRRDYDFKALYGLQYTFPEPEEQFKFELNFETVRTINSTFGDIIRYVLDYPD